MTMKSASRGKTSATEQATPGSELSSAARPLTGAEYIGSIRDGREVYRGAGSAYAEEVK
jgi:hypothetical protein